MKIVILAGGFGTRISESKNSLPKPMVKIGGKPILWHIMKIYSHYGFSDFVVALGYKSEVIKNYFLNFNQLNSDFEIDLEKKEIKYLKNNDEKWKIKLVDTGLNTQTGGRLKKISKFINNERFMLTYGDGLSNINLKELLKFHKKHRKIGTITTVHPSARFGELDLKGNIVHRFKEITSSSLVIIGSITNNSGGSFIGIISTLKISYIEIWFTPNSTTSIVIIPAPL